LQQGNPSEALQLLADAAQRFPGGVLGQERELLSIEALAASGQSASARQRAAAFMQAHPDSAHAARLAPFLPQN
jgi:outer membrane protein assembly factor BamD (BamD/ComL family)